MIKYIISYSIVLITSSISFIATTHLYKLNKITESNYGIFLYLITLYFILVISTIEYARRLEDEYKRI